MTILFNTDTNKQISPILPNGYRVNGQPQAVEPPVFELQYLPTEPPAIEPTQYTTTEWVADTEVGTYTQVWAIHDKTPEQIQAEMDAIENSESNRIAELEATISALITVLNEKGIAP